MIARVLVPCMQYAMQCEHTTNTPNRLMGAALAFIGSTSPLPPGQPRSQFCPPPAVYLPGRCNTAGKGLLHVVPFCSFLPFSAFFSLPFWLAPCRLPFT